MSNTPTERSLGEAATVEVERDLTLTEWIAGIRGRREGVELVTVTDPDGFLSDRIDEIVRQIDGLEDGPEVDALIAEAEDIQSRIVTRRRFVVEQRSRERQDKVRGDALTELGLNADDLSTSQAVEVAFRLILDALVLPDGVTLDDLRHIYDVAPDHIDRLVDAMARANQGSMASEAAVRDFSSRKRRSQRTRKS